jgi:hypothetical protein
MSTIHFKQTTTLTPEQYIAGLTDFGTGRSQLFDNSADADLKVHAESAHHADVTEGSGGTWERLDYDWSDPHVVVREGKNLKGRFLSVALGSVGKGVLRKAFDNSIAAIEARNEGGAGSMAGVAARAEA